VDCFQHGHCLVAALAQCELVRLDFELQLRAWTVLALARQLA
jgi:hypothetical protein